MKELSIEEKAKAYDEALKVLHKYDGVNIMFTQDLKEEMFSELKESEDERIRKDIKQHFLYLDDSFPDKAKWLAWLEKQGEQKSAISDDALREGISHFGITQYQIDNWLKKYVDVEKQDEQKPADNEQKFHKGDWIVHHGTENVYQVVAVIDNQYQLKYGDNYTVQKCADVDRCTRLYDVVKDAKDGDVLATKKGNLFIYDKNRYDNGLAYYYVGLVNKELTIKGPHNMLGHFGELHSVFPATKDQHDTLLKAMADAGWEFDFEKKELKKIEDDKDIMVEPKDYSSIDPHFFKTADKVDPFDKYEGLTDFERTLTDICIGWIGEELGWKQYIKDNADVLLKIAAKKFNSVQDAAFDHKPAWSYEDEANLNNIIWLCNNCIKGSETTWIPSQATKIQHLIETIKEKSLVQQNPAWSEEDKKYLEQTIYVCHQYGYTGCENWLKSLKQRATWKPSEEQMRTLEHYMHTLICTKYKEILFGLYSDLKKLTE